ncbi:hypothetical protein M758_UG063500 [Ceratodon purpureus]|nr:hypothetical protein M758_UG063500 [Ceratodon purpureus]
MDSGSVTQMRKDFLPNVDDDWALSAEEIGDMERNFPQFIEGYEEKMERDRKRGRLNGGWGILVDKTSSSTYALLEESTDPGVDCRLIVSHIDEFMKLCEDHNCGTDFVDELFCVLINSSGSENGNILHVEKYQKSQTRRDEDNLQ